MTEKKKKNGWNIIFFLIGLAGVIWMLLKTDLRQIDWDGAVLHWMPLWLPGILLLWAVIYLLHTLAYRVISGPDAKKLGLWHMFRVTVCGFALNDVTPVGLIGGEPYRIMELKEALGASKAAATTLTFSVMHVFSHIMFWTTGAILYLVLGCPGGTVATVIASVAAALGTLAAVLFLVGKREGKVRAILRGLSKLPWLGRLIARFMEKHRETLDNIDHEMTAFHARPRDFWTTLALEYAGRILEAMEYFIAFTVLEAPVSPLWCIVALGCASLLGNLLFILPLQVGSREGGLALVLSWLGVTSTVSVTASLMTRIREIFYLALGVGLLLKKSK